MKRQSLCSKQFEEEEIFQKNDLCLNWILKSTNLNFPKKPILNCKGIKYMVRAREKSNLEQCPVLEVNYSLFHEQNLLDG
jgi:hypothetical protein